MLILVYCSTLLQDKSAEQPHAGNNKPNIKLCQKKLIQIKSDYDPSPSKIFNFSNL